LVQPRLNSTLYYELVAPKAFHTSLKSAGHLLFVDFFIPVIYIDSCISGLLLSWGHSHNGLIFTGLDALMKPGFSTHLGGFTMLDLVVSMAIMAILVSVAAPSFDGYIRKNAVFSDRKLMNSALMSARYEAVARNKTITLCSTSTGTDCSGTWDDGWLIFLDDGTDGGTARDGDHNGDEPIIQASLYEGKNHFSVTDVSDNSALSYLSFNEYGRPAVDGNQVNRPILIQVCDRKNEDIYARGLMLIGTGRVLQTSDGDGDGIHESRFADSRNAISFSSALSCSP